MTTFASRATGRSFRWLADGLAYGADYNPEQWPEEVWPEDVRLMREAGVTTVSLGIFSWGLLETDDGVFDFGWLDRILDLLDGAGVTVNLATPTAAPPNWLYARYPDIRTVDKLGHRTEPGARLGWCPSSPAFRERALTIARKVAERYGAHPAVRLWHVSNELGNENTRCYCDASAAAFRAWLEARYGAIGALNDAWGTAFWGHRYASFDQVLPPRGAQSHNPGLLLDFERFSSDALLEHFVAERDLLRELTPDIPVTTNMMVARDIAVVDYARWADEVDIVANDHYTLAPDPHREWELAMSGDRMRGMAHGQPWLLMEHSTSAVNWQPRNRAKTGNELVRNGLAHVARGADGVMFFQWRQSTAGAEQFHSAMVPHAGTRSHVWREVVRLGRILASLAELRGSVVAPAPVALLWDYESAWAIRSGPKPTVELDYADLPTAMHGAFTRRHRLVDVVAPSAALEHYAAVVVPNLYLAHDGLAQRLADVAERGGHVLVTSFSGIADGANRVLAGGYPGAYRDLVGAWAEEFHPTLDGERHGLTNGWLARSWMEHLHAETAEVVARYADGDLAGVPAVTRRRLGAGSVSYLGTRLTDESLDQLIGDFVEVAGIPPIAAASDGMEVVRRVTEGASWLFAINHSDHPGSVDVAGTNLLDGARIAETVQVAPGDVAVIREG